MATCVFVCTLLHVFIIYQAKMTKLHVFFPQLKLCLLVKGRDNIRWKPAPSPVYLFDAVCVCPPPSPLPPFPSLPVGTLMYRHTPSSGLHSYCVLSLEHFLTYACSLPPEMFVQVNFFITWPPELLFLLLYFSSFS